MSLIIEYWFVGRKCKENLRQQQRPIKLFLAKGIQIKPEIRTLRKQERGFRVPSAHVQRRLDTIRAANESGDRKPRVRRQAEVRTSNLLRRGVECNLTNALVILIRDEDHALRNADSECTIEARQIASPVGVAGLSETSSNGRDTRSRGHFANGRTTSHDDIS